ncbi:hypothetical protein HYR99_22930 [Candidatus Poribacteria bacterium]|nr:hypothetical protein [Candidatus Poribacteria bacterium]
MLYLFVVSVLIPSFLAFSIAATINWYREKQRQLLNKRMKVEEKELFNRIHQRIQALFEKEGQLEKSVSRKTPYQTLIVVYAVLSMAGIITGVLGLLKS